MILDRTSWHYLPVFVSCAISASLRALCDGKDFSTDELSAKCEIFKIDFTSPRGFISFKWKILCRGFHQTVPRLGVKKQDGNHPVQSKVSAVLKFSMRRYNFVAGRGGGWFEVIKSEVHVKVQFWGGGGWPEVRHLVSLWGQIGDFGPHFILTQPELGITVSAKETD